MYQKFIINQAGVLKFGNVYQHRDLLEWAKSALMEEACGRWMKSVEPFFFMDVRLLLVLLVLNMCGVSNGWALVALRVLSSSCPIGHPRRGCNLYM